MLIEKNDRILIGITGNIASGKSTVAKMFEGDLFLLLDSDGIAKNYLSAEPEIRDGLRDYCRREIFRGDGSIDAALLASAAFEDRELMKRLESMIHPRVMRDIQNAIENTKRPIVIVESALIFEINMHAIFDKIITVFASEEIRIGRLMRRRGISKEEALKRVRFQMGEYLKISRSDYVIDNSRGKRWLGRQVENIREDILTTYRSLLNSFL